MVCGALGTKREDQIPAIMKGKKRIRATGGNEQPTSKSLMSKGLLERKRKISVNVMGE